MVLPPLYETSVPDPPGPMPLDPMVPELPPEDEPDEAKDEPLDLFPDDPSPLDDSSSEPDPDPDPLPDAELTPPEPEL